MYEVWVGDGTDWYILTPSSSYYSSTSFSFCWAAQLGVIESHNPLSIADSHCLELQLELQLTQAICGTWLYNCLTPTCFLWASQLHRIQPVHRSRWHHDIFDRMRLFLDWRLSGGSICYNLPIHIFQNSTSGIFLHVRLHPPSHTFYK